MRNTKRAFELSAKALDPDGMNRFIEQGHLIRKTGGIFEFDIDSYCRVSSVYRQTVANKKYMDAFGDYVACDGTHMIDKFGNLLLIVTVWDSLGLSQVAGCIVAPAESADVLIKGFELFGLGKGEGKTFHTDGGSWGPLVAEMFMRIHLLCANHYTTGKVTYRN